MSRLDQKRHENALALYDAEPFDLGVGARLRANLYLHERRQAQMLANDSGLLEEDLTPAERDELFWKPEDLVVPDRAKLFAADNLQMPLADFVRRGWRVLEPETELAWNWHIDAVCAHLEAVSAGQITRLLINIPPGHMKSLLVNVFWPAWAWLHYPGWRVLCASSGLSLAVRDSGKCKELMQSEWYQTVFRPDWQLQKDSKAKASYVNTRYGLRHAVSVGAATTGFRGNALLIDDPLQVMDVESDTKRPRSIDWYDRAASSRLADPRRDVIVIIMQRLHHEDLSGHVMEGSNDKYEHLMLPSYFETARKYHTVLADTTRWGQWGTDQRTQEKELLFPEIFDEKVLARAEKRMGDLEFAGQHQQRPTPAAGNLFKAEYFCPDPEGKTFWPASLLYDQKIIEAYICWDTAAKKGAHTDYWAGILVAMPADGRVLLVPLVLEKYDVPEGEKRVLLEWAKWKPILGAALHGAPIEEGASNATAVVQNARRLMAHRREQELEFEVWRQNGYDENAFDWKTPVGWESDEWNSVCESPPFHPLPYPPKPTKKVPRARGVLSFCQGRNARLVSIDDYVTRQWLSQLLAFPLGHDDAVDATVTGLERVAGLNDNAPAAGDDIVSRMKFKKRIVTP